MIRMFLGLPDPYPDPLVTSSDPALGQAPDPGPAPDPEPFIRGTEPRIRSASVSVLKCHGSATVHDTAATSSFLFVMTPCSPYFALFICQRIIVCMLE